MTTDEYGPGEGNRRLTPADAHNVRFSRATMLRPGYLDAEVDRFTQRVAEELARLHAEKADLRDRVRALQAQIDGAEAPITPSDQAVRLLATAQQTADTYVAEAEDFSRQMTSDARSQHDEQLRRARETAGAIIQSAQEAAARAAATGGHRDGESSGRSTEELEEQVAYLKAFAQACRVQLRAYLEALLTDVENEWGRADPGALPLPPLRTPAQRSPGTDEDTPASLNVAREVPRDNSTGDDAEVLGLRR